MEKKKDLWVIPTDKPSRLYSFYGILEDLSYGKTFTIVNEDIAKINLHKDLKDYQEKLIKAGWNAENIFITSDEEIKKGNWYLEEKSKFNPRKLISEEWGDGQHFKTFNQKGFRKIILTTDTDLIADGVQSIEDDFLEWFVQYSSCEWVEVKKGKMKLNDDGEEYGFPDMSLYKIIIPKEPKQETLEEAAKIGEFAEKCYSETYKT